MEQTYVIIWTTKTRDGAGIGQKLFTQMEAQSLASELNVAHPQFIHQPLDTATRDAKQGLEELREALLHQQRGEVSFNASESKPLVVDFLATAGEASSIG